MQPQTASRERSPGAKTQVGFLVVRLNARSTLVTGVEREPRGERFVVHTEHAIPLEVYQKLHRWRSRTWKRLLKYKILDFMGVPLYSAADYDEIKRVLDKAVEEYNKIIEEIPDEEVRVKFHCNPQILVVTPPPAFQAAFRQDISEAAFEELLKRIERALNHHYDRDPELERKFYEVNAKIEALMERLEQVQSSSLDARKLVEAMRASEALREVVTQLTAIRVASKVDRKHLRPVEDALRRTEKIKNLLTPEARKLLEVAKQHLEAIKAGQCGDMASAIAELEQALLKPSEEGGEGSE